MLERICEKIQGLIQGLKQLLGFQKSQDKPMTHNEALAIFQCDEAPSKKAIEWTYKCKAKLYNEYKNLDFYRIRLERLEEAKILLLRHLEN